MASFSDAAAQLYLSGTLFPPLASYPSVQPFTVWFIVRQVMVANSAVNSGIKEASTSSRRVRHWFER